MIRRLLGGIQFLTVIPVGSATADPGRSAIFFPLIGALIGVAGGAVLEAARGRIPFTIAALAVLVLWMLVTGGLHEDGLADVVDAFRANRSPEKIHAILKDSRIGSHGALALIFASLLKWQALSSIAVDNTMVALAAVHAIARTGMLVLAWTARPARPGLGAEFSRSLSTAPVLFAILQAIAIAVWCGPRAAYWAVVGTVAIVWLARRYFHKRIGGITGDCLGATEQVIETYLLVLFTCRSCI
jgi:cobalamin 5''-phosphate synthase/cobalamin synthase